MVMNKGHAGLLALVLTAPALAAQAPDRIRVSAERDGVLLVIGTEIKPGEKVAPDRVVIVPVGGMQKSYRTWQEGDAVDQGDLLARLDDRLVRGKVAVKAAAVEAAEAKHKAAVSMKEEAKRRLASILKLRQKVKDAVSDDAVGAAMVTVDRYINEEVAAAAQIRRAKADLAVVQAELALYEVRSPTRGVIGRIERTSGEAVKKGQTFLIIHTRKAWAAVGKELTVPSQSEGRLIALGIPIAPGEKAAADETYEVEVGILAVEAARGEKVAPEDQVVVPGSAKEHRRWKEGDDRSTGKVVLAVQKVRFRPLGVGDNVRAGQLLGLVNSRLTLALMASKLALLEEAETRLRATTSIKEESQRRLKSIESLRERISSSVTDDDLGGARATVLRYQSEEVARAADVRRARVELQTAATVLQLHEIRTPAAGRVTAISRHRGEYVKELQGVLKLGVGAPAKKP